MKKIEIDRELLLSVLKNVNKTIPSKSTLPITAECLVEVTKSQSASPQQTQRY